MFNDFTFFLNDPVNGDMINQRDTRFLAGFNTHYEIDSKPFGMPLTSTAGFQYRIDTPRVVLANAVQRFQLGRTQDVSIVEQSFSPFVKFDLTPVDKVRLITGARGDVFTFHGNQHVNTTGSDLNGNVTKARPNVKANLVLGPWAQTEFYGNFGTGYHSNDARAVLSDSTQQALPTARGYEFGFRSRALPRTEFFATYWFLDLQSELVFVGDEGTTEAKGPTHREGLEVGVKHPALGLAHLHRRLHVDDEGALHRDQLRHRPVTHLDGPRRPHRAPALRPVFQLRDALSR